MCELGEQEQAQGSKGKSGSDNMVDSKKPSAVDIFRKLKRILMGSMIGMHQVEHLGEHGQDQVLLSLFGAKVARKFSKPIEMIAKKWLWYSKDTMTVMDGTLGTRGMAGAAGLGQ